MRVAAQRDKDIGALVCHGGLVDLAGLQYLKVLQAPLLFFADIEDILAARNLQRAKAYLPGIVEMERLPTPSDLAAGFAAEHTTRWFERHLGR